MHAPRAAGGTCQRETMRETDWRETRESDGRTLHYIMVMLWAGAVTSLGGAWRRVCSARVHREVSSSEGLEPVLLSIPVLLPKSWCVRPSTVHVLV